MNSFEELEEALLESDRWVDASRRTDSSDASVYEQAAQRIHDLNEVKVEQEQRFTELKEKVEKKKLADTKEKLLKEKEELKKKIADQKAMNAELDRQAASLRETLQDSKRHGRKLFADADLEIDKLKEARMNIFQKAHSLPEDKISSTELVEKKSSVVSDTAPSRKVLCYDGLDPIIDELKQRRMRIFQDARRGGN